MSNFMETIIYSGVVCGGIAGLSGIITLIMRGLNRLQEKKKRKRAAFVLPLSNTDIAICDAIENLSVRNRIDIKKLEERSRGRTHAGPRKLRANMGKADQGGNG